MPRTKKDTDGTPKRSDAQKKADKRYQERNKANQRENFKNISATIKRPKAEAIAATFKAHGVTVAEVVTAAAYTLDKDGQAAAVAIKERAAAYTEKSQSESESQEAEAGNEKEAGGEPKT